VLKFSAITTFFRLCLFVEKAEGRLAADPVPETDHYGRSAIAQATMLARNIEFEISTRCAALVP
jgi:hypothetical protein